MLALEPRVFSSIVSDIYDCALDPTNWAPTLTRINSVLDCVYTNISVVDANQNRVGRLLASSPFDPQAYAVAVTANLNELEDVRQVMNGDLDTPKSTMQVMSEAQFHQTPFYNQWVKPNGLREACITKFIETSERSGYMLATKGASQNIFTDDEREFCALVSPHLRRAAMISDLFNYEKVKANTFEKTLQQLSTPVFLLDQHANILFANESAGHYLNQQKGLTIPTNSLQLEDPAAQKALLETLSQIQDNHANLGSKGIAIPITHANDHRCIAHVLPLLTPLQQSKFDCARAAVFIANSNQPDAPSADLLAALYDLTPKEAAVMLSVANGATCALAAKQLFVSENTIKTHLSRVFTKTGVHRQVDLANIINRLESPITNSTNLGLPSSSLESNANRVR
jgi:DNA-binding CsgD family transcriptional regulator